MPNRAFSSAVTATADVLRSGSMRRIVLAWTLGIAADWAFLVVLLVVAYDEGGALAVGLLGAVRVVPQIVVTPFASALVGRVRGDVALTTVNLTRCAGVLATGAVVGLGLPVELMYLLAAVVAGAGSLVRPIQLSLLPALARTPGELVAANVASSIGEGIGTFGGPLLAGLLVAWTGSAPASLLIAAGFAAAAAAVTGIRFESDADARGGSGERAEWFDPRRVPAVIRTYPGPSLVIGDFVVQIFVRGLLTAFIVVVALELLDLGDGGVGLLSAMIGLGGFVGALGALALVGVGRLPRLFTLSLVGWGLPLVLIGVVPVVPVALVALFATGISNALLDVAGFTLVQRGVRNEDRVTVFGVMEALLGVGLLLGSLLAPAMLAVLDVRGALVVAGAILPLVALLTWRPIAAHTRQREGAEELLALLRRNALFAPLPLTTLERVMDELVPVAYESGTVVMEKGEAGTSYLLIASGEVDVTDDGRPLGRCGPGDGVGEIALLRRVPRTASVTARGPLEGYELGAPAFLAAIAGPRAAAAAESLVATRLGRSPTPDTAP
jgi:MFS family permease